MGKLIYAINMSLDGFMEDADGKLNWSVPDDEVFDFWTEFQIKTDLDLYGRGMYEAMVYWETVKPDPDIGDKLDRLYQFARAWQDTDKIVYSRTLDHVSSKRTELRRDLNPDEIRRLKLETDSDISISGQNIASQAMALGLLDECHVNIFPIILASGKPALPQIPYQRLEFICAQTFASGAVYLKYKVIN
ncbi:dihydrofolate reductase family protein [Fundicoccus culcitae]|uniref:Dihydrofolate reductase family protein n=1 Tax=Fundicoccus culcitae TaxID=2969821 RepID=A0ABY5P7U1_9LACT|nr:dihydrofolate reductase family protein [Fundicoccus culcitae]UUX34811.1 dihydrofolate reductase family protein [Fundicoccus culcitae]